MRHIKYAGVAAAALVLTACTVRSLHPLYTDKDLIFEPGLLGAWGDPNDPSESWTLHRSGDNGYGLVRTEQGKVTARLGARLVRLSDALFLDLYPKEADEAFTIRAHVFARVWLQGDALRAAVLDPDWLREQLRRNPNLIAHAWLREEALGGPGGTTVLTASTNELQEFVVRYANDSQAFPPQELRRR